MPFSAVAANYQLDQWGASKGLFMSAHSAYSATGANELSGGSYARVAVTWSAAAGSSKSLSGTPYTVNVPAGATVEYIGFWDAATLGNFQGMWPDAVTASPYAFAAPSSTGVLLAPGSGYLAGQPVTVLPTGGSVLPGGLTAGTVYYVRAPAGDSFSLAASPGGAAITLSSDGSGYVQAIAVVSFVSAGTLTVSSATLSII